MSMTNNRGFTLVETLMSIVIVSLAMLLISAAIVVFTKSFENISYKSNMDVLLNEYERVISTDLENSKFTGDYYDEKEVIESAKFKCYGIYDSVDGVVVFKTLMMDDEFVFADKTIKILPLRNHYIGNKEKHPSVNFTYLHDDCSCLGVLTVNNQTKTRREFSVTIFNEINSGDLDEEYTRVFEKK